MHDHRQKDYADQEARLIEKRNSERTVQDFIENVHNYNYNRESVQLLLAFKRLSTEDQATVLESFK